MDDRPHRQHDRQVPLPDRLRLPFAFDADLLRADLAALRQGEWTAHFVPDHYAGDWSVLPLRAPAGAVHPILRISAPSNAASWVDTEFLGVCRYIPQVLARFACPVGSVRLMRLGAGSTIKPHRDFDLDAGLGNARLHVPLTTNAEVDFRLNGERVEMRPGECWYLRLADVHEVTNHGASDRVHLVIDCAVDDWLEGVLAEAAADQLREGKMPVNAMHQRIAR